MVVNAVSNSGFIAGDNQIHEYTKQNPINKCPDETCKTSEKTPLDINIINKLPGGCFGGGIKPLFNRCENIIDDAMSQAHAKMFGAQTQALRSFCSDIKGMDQQELDEMKDTLVKRMGSEDSSQWERNLLQKMYEITDAVAEHRTPPHIGNRFELQPYKPGIEFIDLMKQGEFKKDLSLQY